MYLLGFSLNNLTLMALTISTGFVVDDAIVMIENIARYVEAGETPLAAALKGAEQIGFTIVSLTVSLIAVLIPLLFMGDIVGRLFREFAVTLAIAILVSAVVSLTLTPMMCARILRHVPEERAGPAGACVRARLQGRIDRYATDDAAVGAAASDDDAGRIRSCAGDDVRAVCHRAEGLLPRSGHRRHHGRLGDAPRPPPSRRMAERQQELAAIVLRDPAVDSLSSFIGVDGVNLTPNSGRIQINLKPLAERKIDASAVIRRLAGTAGQRRRDHALHAARAGPDGRRSHQPHPVPIQPRSTRIRRNSVSGRARLLDKLRTLPELTDIASDQQNGGLRALVVIDRDAAARLGVTAAQI